MAYKIFTKLMVERIKPLLDNLIFLNQVVFVPGCWISENVILTNEIIHSLKKKKGGKSIAGLKIDMQKAYDKID